MSSLYRALSLYAVPAVLMSAGLIGMALIDPAPAVSVGIEQVLAPIKRMVFFGACGVTIIGVLWGAWSAYLDYRWTQGKLNGGCHHCGGPMRHKDGRWGAYSKCIMCGSKREGWH